MTEAEHEAALERIAELWPTKGLEFEELLEQVAYHEKQVDLFEQAIVALQDVMVYYPTADLHDALALVQELLRKELDNG